MLHIVEETEESLQTLKADLIRNRETQVGHIFYLCMKRNSDIVINADNFQLNFRDHVLIS